MNATILLENTLLHNGMNVGKSTPQSKDLPAVAFLAQFSKEGGKKRRWRFLLPLLMMLGLVLLVSAPLDEGWVWDKLEGMMLIPKEDPYTALYFEYYDDLPKKGVAGEMVDFTFTIKNSEGYDKEYHYDIYLKETDGREKIRIAQGAVTIQAGGSATISQSYILPQTYREATINVELPESGRRIHFILKNEV